MTLNTSIQDEVNDLIKKLWKINDNAKKESQAIFSEAAGPLISAIRGRAPISEKAHHRYNTAKISRRIRAPKGKGNIVATYEPGNLGRSFKVLKFRRSPAVFVGPDLGKGSGGTFKGSRADGYYAHFVEFGADGGRIPAQPFVRPAVDATGQLVLRFAAELLKREILKSATR